MSTTPLAELKQEMEKGLDALKSQLSKIHTGRANPGLLEDVQVEYYGNVVPLKQIANITVPESRQLVVQPWDKGALTAIEKSITQSNLGLNPQNEGSILRIHLPIMTEERRKQMKKIMDDITEKARVSMRGHRHEAIKSIKQQETNKAISEDESRRLQDEVQTLTDAMNKEIDNVHKHKVDELMTV